MSKNEGFRLKGWHILALILALAVLMGWISFEFVIPGTEREPSVIYTAPDGTQFGNYNDYLAYMYENYPGISPEPMGTPVSETHPAAQIQFSSNDFITRSAVTTATTTADLCKANENGLFDLMNQADTLTVSSTPDQTNVYFGDGDQVIIRVDCTGDPTGGLDYYDGWYYFVLHEGNPVYFVTFDMLQDAGSNKYRVVATGAQQTGYVVTFTSGTTNYWDVGQLYLYPRSSAANFDIYFVYQSTQLASVTNGATWIDTNAGITANATLASTDEIAYFEVYAGATNIGWGWDQLVVTSTGEVKCYKPVIIMSTAMTAISASKLQNDGWSAISDNTLTAEKAFYKVLGPQYTTKGSKMDFRVEIPIDSSAAASSTQFLFKLWIIDFQNPENVAIGSVSTSVPTAYGFVTAYGPGAMIQARAYTTASGAGDNEALRAHFTTP